MNAIGENLAELATSRATASHTRSSDITASPGNCSDIDSTNLNFTITTIGGDVLAHFQGAIHHVGSGGQTVCFDLEVDGSRQSSGLVGIISAGLDGDLRVPIGFTYLVTNLSAGPHTFKFQWRGHQGRSVKLKEDAQFWVREI